MRCSLFKKLSNQVDGILNSAYRRRQFSRIFLEVVNLYILTQGVEQVLIWKANDRDQSSAIRLDR